MPSSFGASTILNFKTARSQTTDGITYDIGMALRQETFYYPERAKVGCVDRSVVYKLADYHVASHANVPDIRIEFMGKPDLRINSLGRGLGDVEIKGVAAALGK